MKRRHAILVVFLLVGSCVAFSEPRALTFVKKIGVGWRTDKFGWMSFVAFKGDGSMVASDASTGPDDVSGDLTLWTFPEGRLVKRLPFQAGDVSGNWKYYASSRGVGEIETGKSIISIGESAYAIFAFSPDSRYVAESLPGRGTNVSHVRIVALADGKEVRAFGRHNVFSMAISPDGQTLATGHWDVVTLWNMFTGDRIAVLRGFGRYVDSLGFSPDGSLLAAGTDSGGLQIWDVHTGIKLHSLEVEGSYVSQPAFSPDGRLVAVGTYVTGTVWLIDVRSGKILDQRKVSDLGCGSVAFGPDGRFLITPSTGGLVTWPYDRGGTIRVFSVNAP